MKIIRDGNEYELTWQEMREAFEIMSREYLKEDIESRAEEMEIELSVEDIGRVISIANKSLENNDSYWDSYWMTIEYAIETVREN